MKLLSCASAPFGLGRAHAMGDGDRCSRKFGQVGTKMPDMVGVHNMTSMRVTLSWLQLVHTLASSAISEHTLKKLQFDKDQDQWLG